MKLFSVIVVGNNEKTYIVAENFSIASGAAVNQHGSSIIQVGEVHSDRVIVVPSGR
jgi:hypothetical protein